MKRLPSSCPATRAFNKHLLELERQRSFLIRLSQTMYEAPKPSPFLASSNLYTDEAPFDSRSKEPSHV